MKQVKFIDYSRDYHRFKNEYDQAWQRINETGQLILQADVEEFEQKLAEFVGTRFAVALSSGTAAIYLALKALGIGKGHKVSLPSHTFKATCGAVINAGAEPIVYDMNGYSYDDRPDAQIIVHIAGELSPVPNTDNFVVIEDACQALGAVKNPTSKVQCWSFYPAKLCGCKGDAGAITTNDEKIYEYVKEARNHFKESNQDFGINGRCDNIQTAILNVKIKYINDIIGRRQEIADMYYAGLGELEKNGKIKLPNKQIGRVYQDFILQILE